MSLRVAVRAARPAFRPIVTPLRSIHSARFAAPAFVAPSRPILISKMATGSAAASTQAKAGDKIPSVPIRTGDMSTTVDFSTLPGKNILVTVPGAFTPTCHSQVPGFVGLYDKFKAKGINDIYIVTVNDLFVVNAWKKDLDAGNIKFAADDQAKLAAALGIVLDAKGGLGNDRLKRAVIVIEDGKIVSLDVEPDSGKSTVTQAENFLKQI